MVAIYFVLFASLVDANYYVNRINHMEFYRNRTRPSKAFASFSNSYFSQNSIESVDRVQCGTRSVNFTPGRLAKIVGGSESPYGAFPWQVDIQLLDPERLTFRHHCGGAIVADRLVISAAHCFDKHPAAHLRVVAGEHRLSAPDALETRYVVDKVVMHPEFRKEGPHSNDIALVLVRGRGGGGGGVAFNSHVRPICLPAPDPPAPAAPGAPGDPRRWCAVSGWGLQDESTESFAPSLRAAAVPLMDLGTCRRREVLGGRQQPILDSMICAGALTGGVDACRGDSGGPLACPRGGRYSLLGVVSWGAGCARRARPGVYTRVASYLTWIRAEARALDVQL